LADRTLALSRLWTLAASRSPPPPRDGGLGWWWLLCGWWWGWWLRDEPRLVLSGEEEEAAAAGFDREVLAASRLWIMSDTDLAPPSPSALGSGAAGPRGLRPWCWRRYADVRAGAELTEWLPWRPPPPR
jgi:hypothetical protein